MKIEFKFLDSPFSKRTSVLHLHVLDNELCREFTVPCMVVGYQEDIDKDDILMVLPVKDLIFGYSDSSRAFADICDRKTLETLDETSQVHVWPRCNNPECSHLEHMSLVSREQLKANNALWVYVTDILCSETKLLYEQWVDKLPNLPKLPSLKELVQQYDVAHLYYRH